MPMLASSSHFIVEEEPQQAARAMRDFFA